MKLITTTAILSVLMVTNVNAQTYEQKVKLLELAKLSVETCYKGADTAYKAQQTRYELLKEGTPDIVIKEVMTENKSVLPFFDLIYLFSDATAEELLANKEEVLEKSRKRVMIDCLNNTLNHLLK